MSSDRLAPLHGTVSNPSRTPRNEVGGLAVFEGVLMRSRTGFAIAVRRRDGRIKLSQFPFASLISRSRTMGLPVLRGAAALGEMMVIGTRALRYSSAMVDDEEPEESSLGRVIVLSLALMMALLVLLPNVLASISIGLFAPGIVEADHPFLFNVVSGLWRLIAILVYIAAISINSDIRRVFEYHGAEHKAVLALEEGGDVTVDRARRHDTLHPRCGTTLLALIAIVAVPVFALLDVALHLYVSGYPDWHYVPRKVAQVGGHLLVAPLAIGIGFELIKHCSRRPRRWYSRVLLWPGFLLQRLTTRQPNDEQIEVAIAALLGALAIGPHDRRMRTWSILGLEDDPSAPGYRPRSPARPAAPGTGSALEESVDQTDGKGTVNGSE